MGFIDNIKTCIGENFEGVSEPTFRAVLFGEHAVYFENVRSIIRYSPQEIKLAVKKGGVSVRGEGLYLKKYCSGDVVICGKIKAIEKD